jgi:hypothetical protein
VVKRGFLVITGNKLSSEKVWLTALRAARRDSLLMRVKGDFEIWHMLSAFEREDVRWWTI